jgi:WD40 repeat protein
MRKLLLSVLFFGWLMVGCGESIVPATAETPIPSPSPVPTVPPPTLIKEIEIETQTDTAYTLDWSPDSEVLAVASGYEITLVSSDLNKIHAVLRPEGGGLAVSWNPDQKKFATVNGYRNPTVKLWDWDSVNNQLVLAQQIEAGSDQYGVFWSPDGKLLATLADDDKSTFRIWDGATGEELHTYELPFATPLRTSSWSADSSTLYIAGESNGQIIVMELSVTDGTVQEVAKFPVNEAVVFAFSPDAKKLIVADEHGIAQIVDAASGEMLTEFKSVDQPVDIAWNPDGSTLAILGYKTQLQLWNVGP